MEYNCNKMLLSKNRGARWLVANHLVCITKRCCKYCWKLMFFISSYKHRALPAFHMLAKRCHLGQELLGKGFLDHPDGSLSRQRRRKREGREKGKAPLPVPLALTTIGYVTADVTSHQGKRDPGRSSSVFHHLGSFSRFPPSFPLFFSF